MNTDQCVLSDTSAPQVNESNTEHQDGVHCPVTFPGSVSRAKQVYRLELFAPLTEENNALRAENDSLRHQLDAIHKLCLKAEDDATRMRKELQFQIETVQSLQRCLQQRKCEGQPEPENPIGKESLDDEERVMVRPQSDDCRTDVVQQILQFMETLPSMLSKLDLTSGAPVSVGTSRACAVTRAVTVNCRPPRTVDVGAVGKSPPSWF